MNIFFGSPLIELGKLLWTSIGKVVIDSTKVFVGFVFEFVLSILSYCSVYTLLLLAYQRNYILLHGSIFWYKYSFFPLQAPAQKKRPFLSLINYSIIILAG